MTLVLVSLTGYSTPSAPALRGRGLTGRRAIRACLAALGGRAVTVFKTGTVPASEPGPLSVSRYGGR